MIIVTTYSNTFRVLVLSTEERFTEYLPSIVNECRTTFDIEVYIRISD